MENNDIFKEIEEIANIVDNALQSDFDFTDVKALEVADEIINKLGYHKQVWHKVDDGDLPEDGQKDLRVVLEWLGVRYYDYGTYTKSDGWFLRNNANPDAKLIAWIELPRYKEVAND